MLREIEVKGLYGCQLLDYFSLYATGVPVMIAVIDRCADGSEQAIVCSIDGDDFVY